MPGEIQNLSAVWIVCGRCGQAPDATPTNPKGKPWPLAGSGQNGVGIGFIWFFNQMPVQKTPEALATRKTPLILCKTCRSLAGMEGLLLPSSRAKVHVACMRCGFVSRMDAADYRKVFFEASSKAPDEITGMRTPPVLMCNACTSFFSTWGRAKDDPGIQG